MLNQIQILDKIQEKILISKNLFFTHRKTAIKITAWIIFLLILSFSFEYFFFGKELHSLEKSEKGTRLVEKNQIEKDGFELNSSLFFVSQKENSQLIITNQKKYIHNLKINLEKNTNFPILVKFINPETGQEITLEKKLQNTLEKNKLNFLNQFIFNISSSPQKIIVEAKKPETAISEISVDNSYLFNFNRFIFIFSILLLFFIFLKFRKKITRKPEIGFLAVSLVCGSLIAITSTISYSSWDERIHYSKTDNKSFKWIVQKKIDDVYSRATSIPFSYSIKEQKEINAYFDNNFKKKQVKNDSKDFSFLTFYNRIAYLPTGLIIFIGRIFQVPHHIIFILGRIANLLLFSLIIFSAIKKLKRGKMLLATIALFPTSLFLASHYGYDHWVIAFVALSMAYFFSALEEKEKKLSLKDALIMIGTLIIGLGPKAIYFPLFFLFFLLKKDNFRTKKDYQVFITTNIVAILLVLGSFLLPFLIFGPDNGDKRGGGNVNSTEQVNFILKEPLVYSKILFNFLKEYLHPKNYSGFITSFAYLGHISGFSILFLFLLWNTFFDNQDNNREKIFLWKTKLYALLIFLATVALISTALYIDFTPVKSPTINGVQPRYLVPLLFPLFFILGKNNLLAKFSFKKITPLLTLIIISVLIFHGVWNLIVRFYY